MPQPKQHKNAAQKQAAYRSRRPKPPTQARLAQLARAIDDIIPVNCNSADRKLPANIVGHDTEKTLRNLICWLDPDKDTIRYPDWELFHP
ncbi:MAG TPA: hypothetical protein VGK19_17255 [Capsulimonadaceae bacterium]|jgi:hypothetical protein